MKKAVHKVNRKNPHAVALGRRGGKIGGKLGGRRIAEERGPGYMAKLGRKSYASRIAKYGPDFLKRVRRGGKLKPTEAK